MPSPQPERRPDGPLVGAIARTEVGVIARTPIFWVATAAIVFAASGLVLWQLETYEALQAKLRATPGSRSFHDIVLGTSLSIVTWVMVPVMPLVAARAIVDERARGTLLVLFASPVSALDLVAGKFLAHWLAALVPVALVGALLALLAAFFPLDTGQVVAGTAGLALVATAVTAIAIACSAACRQVTSAVLATLVVLAALNLTGGLVPGQVEAGPSRFTLFGQIAPWFLGVVPLSSALAVGALTAGALATATVLVASERHLA